MNANGSDGPIMSESGDWNGHDGAIGAVGVHLHAEPDLVGGLVHHVASLPRVVVVATEHAEGAIPIAELAGRGDHDLIWHLTSIVHGVLGVVDRIALGGKVHVECACGISSPTSHGYLYAA